MFRDISEAALSGRGIDEGQILAVLKAADGRETDLLADLAYRTRRKFLGEQACIHGIIEFSNWCRRNCAYCGVRCGNAKAERYRLEPDEMVELGVAAVEKLGYKMIMLQSGEDPWYDTDILAGVVKKIYDRVRPLIFLSIGERDAVAYEKLYLAGARGALFRFETSDRKLFERHHPGASFDSRLEHLRFMRDLGYVVATGPLVGLPGQDVESLARDIVFARKNETLMVSTGPLVPHPDTPLADAEPPSPGDVRRVIIAARLAMPRVRIPVTTAMEHLWGDDFRRTALRSGGNAFMLNLTPESVRDSYDIYPGKNRERRHIHTAESFGELTDIIEECGLHLCRGFGKEFELTRDEFAGGCEMQ